VVFVVRGCRRRPSAAASETSALADQCITEWWYRSDAATGEQGHLWFEQARPLLSVMSRWAMQRSGSVSAVWRVQWAGAEGPAVGMM
jgi:hypothetical protein